jgi:hypothetical protein
LIKRDILPEPFRAKVREGGIFACYEYVRDGANRAQVLARLRALLAAPQMP